MDLNIPELTHDSLVKFELPEALPIYNKRTQINSEEPEIK